VVPGTESAESRRACRCGADGVGQRVVASPAKDTRSVTRGRDAVHQRWLICGLVTADVPDQPPLMVTSAVADTGAGDHHCGSISPWSAASRTSSALVLAWSLWHTFLR